MKKEPELTSRDCFGLGPKTITLSWSRLSDWTKCKRRVKLIHEGKRSNLVNARNFLAGNLADHSMREALENAPKDPEGRLLSLSLDELLKPLPKHWAKAMEEPEEGRIYKWAEGDPVADQRRILKSATQALENLYPTLQEYLLGRRFVPEFRPKKMPVFGIPGPDGEPCYIRLYLAVDCAVQLKEDPDNLDGMGEWGLYDLKTTAQAEYLNQTLPQLVFYDLGFQALTGKRPVEHALWAPLQSPVVRKVHVTDEHRAQVTNWIVSYCHSVWAGEDDFTDKESNCFTCPTKSACPKMVTPLTKDEQGISRVYFGKKEGMLHG